MDLTALIAGLSESSAYPFPVTGVEVCQTHISVVFLAGEFAYKVKKPFKLSLPETFARTSPFRNR